MSIVLMYHNVFPDNDTRTIDPEDLPYAVSVSDFTRQLDMLAGRNVGLLSQGKTPEIVITFDDGHASNLELAAPLLLERNLPAYFFITSRFIDHRPFFMTADDVSTLSAMPGMCIGSHGATHRFFDDMSTEESMQELVKSRQALETMSGALCHSISFPGGRYLPQTLDQLVQAGYTQWFGSEIGLIDNNRLQHGAEISNEKSDTEDRWSLVEQCDTAPLQRVAVRRNTQLEEFQRIIDQDPAYFRRKQLVSQAKNSARRILGNRLYHGLYKSLAAR